MQLKQEEVHEKLQEQQERKEQQELKEIAAKCGSTHVEATKQKESKAVAAKCGETHVKATLEKCLRTRQAGLMGLKFRHQQEGRQ